MKSGGWLLVVALACVLPWSGAAGQGRADDDQVAAERKARQQRLMEISCRQDREQPQGWLDSTHSYLSQRLCEPAAWFDGFFGDKRTLEENPVGSFLRLRNSARWDQTHGWNHRASVRANLILPQLSERVRLLVARDEDLEGDFQGGRAFDDSEDRTRLGLRYTASEKARSRFDIDGTIRVTSGSLNPRIGGRYRYVRGLSDRTLGRFTQMAFWERHEGLGLTSRVDFEWLPDRNRLVRVSTRGTWSQESDGVDWRAGITAFRQLDLKSALRYDAGAFGRTDPNFRTEEYYVSVRYRRQFLRNWLYWEIQPEHAWPLDFDTDIRRRDWRLTFTLEVQFENQRSRQHRLEHYLDEDDGADVETWGDAPIPVDAPGDRVDDPMFDKGEDEAERGERKKDGKKSGQKDDGRDPVPI